jgi:ABC-type oligopeptide transport system substrate-binding subunit
MRGLLRARWAAGALVFALAITACGGDDEGGDEGAGATGGDISMYIAEPESLTPGNDAESEGAQVLRTLFTGLVTYNIADSKQVNANAESITASPDQKKFTIKLKPGWKFHNGETVTAKSYVDTWNWVTQKASAQSNAYFFEKVVGYADNQAGKTKEMAGLKLVDDNTFTVELGTPFSQFPLTLGYNAFYPVPAAGLADMKAYNEAPIGNGPFKIEGKWEHNQQIKLVKFDDYGGENKAKADTATFKIYQKIETAFQDLRAGTLDIMDTIPPAEIATAKSEFGGRYIEKPLSTFTYLGFPLYDKRFQNKDLRIAFSQAIDREAITKNIFSNTRVPATGVVSPVVAGGRKDACGDLCKYKPEAAKAAFKRAGGFPGGKIELWFNAGAGHDQWVQAAGNNIKAVLGVDYVLKGDLQFAQYLELGDNKKFTGPFRLGWIMDYPSAENFLAKLYVAGADSNYTGYSNPEVTNLIHQGDAAPSLEEGITLYNQAEDLVLKDMPNIPMFYSNSNTAFSDRVEGVDIDAFGNIDLAAVSVKK